MSTGQGVLGNNMFAYCSNNPVSRKDPTGQLWIAAFLVVAVCTVFLSACSAQPAPPADYKQENSPVHNCYSYAFGLQYGSNPGDFYADIHGTSRMYDDKDRYTADEITDFVMKDMSVLDIEVRVVNSPAEKLDNEYIVAMKTATKSAQLKDADYHFAVLLSDGTWADKPGMFASRWNALDGTAIAWDLGNSLGYYDSKTVYFAVAR